MNKYSQYVMPAEYQAADAVWMSWAGDSQLWGALRPQAMCELANLIVELSQHTSVHVNAGASISTEAESYLKGAGVNRANLMMHDIPTEDVWCRDHGPTFVTKKFDRTMAAVDWHFQGWGKKHPHEIDSRAAHLIAEAAGASYVSASIIAEGGAIEINRRGELLTTESVCLNANRNPGIARNEMEEALEFMLGVRRIHWISEGLPRDDTDGHVDMVARFLDDDTIALADPNTSKEPRMREHLERIEEEISDFRTIDGKAYQLVYLPCPVPLGKRHPHTDRVETVPASYLNFLIHNRAIYYPTYGQTENDEGAGDCLRKHCPWAAIIPVSCKYLSMEGGAVHCLTQQIPSLDQS